MPDDIVLAASTDDYAAFGDLVREYWEWLRDCYANVPGWIDDVGGHQAIDVELTSLREKYAPPHGAVLLARRGSDVIGCGAYWDLGDGVCEMKRLFVPDRFQGKGTGSLLCQALIDRAADEGYAWMRLDTGDQNTSAIAMYTAMGFRQCDPYRDYPAELLTHLLFMERRLTAS